jgi:uncharacterized protein (TIGR02599 family)
MATPQPRAHAPHAGQPASAAFTLVEILVATALLVIVIGLVMRMTHQTSQIWRSSTSRIQSFQEARSAFESMNLKIGQATLKTYYDYYDSGNKARRDIAPSQLASFTPATYDRISDLRFVCGQSAALLASGTPAITTQTHAVFFQAPLGYSSTYAKLKSALNACGYFLQFDDAASFVPDHVKNAAAYVPRHRFRLMEMLQDTERLEVYTTGASPSTANNWFAQNAAGNSRIAAENVIALVLLPKLADRDDNPAAGGRGVSLAPNYNFDSAIPLAATSNPFWPSASPAFPGDAFTAYPAAGGFRAMTRHHQLPPILRIVMVVIDEVSAQRLEAGSSIPPGLDLRNAGLFQDAGRLDADIAAVEDLCNAKPGNVTGNTLKLNYQVFTTDILMREAKWSNN